MESIISSAGSKPPDHIRYIEMSRSTDMRGPGSRMR